MRWRLALRNIIRHRLRSALSIFMIAGAVLAIIIFRGFSDYSLSALKVIAAENQFGHIQIAKEKYWSPGKESRAERMFSLNEISSLKEANKDINSISGRLSFYGLVSNGDLSVGAKMIGVDINGEPQFSKTVLMMSGVFFTGPTANEAIVGRLLAKQLNLKEGDNVTILTNTIDGVMNAMDLTVTGIFSAGIDEIDAQFIYLPLSVTQAVLDTDQVDIAVIKLNDVNKTDGVQKNIETSLKSFNTNLFSKTWRELAVLFRQVEKYYGVQNSLVEGILLILMFLGILNTVSMTVVERTGEIGTLRSMGEKRSDIVKQFVLESFILSIVGIIVGVIFSSLMISLIHGANIMTEMPGASTPFQIKIHFLVSSVVYASILSMGTALFATGVPAYRAARLDIVDALRKNI